MVDVISMVLHAGYGLWNGALCWRSYNSLGTSIPDAYCCCFQSSPGRWSLLVINRHCRPPFLFSFSLKQIQSFITLLTAHIYERYTIWVEAIHFGSGDRTELFNTQISNISILIACNVYAWNLWHAFRSQSSNKFEYGETRRTEKSVESNGIDLVNVCIRYDCRCPRRMHDSIASRIYCCRLSVCFHSCAHNVPSPSEHLSGALMHACCLFIDVRNLNE